MELGGKARGRHSAGLQAETLDDTRYPAERIDQRGRISALRGMGMLPMPVLYLKLRNGSRPSHQRSAVRNNTHCVFQNSP